jgi:hypothetical protein
METTTHLHFLGNKQHHKTRKYTTTHKCENKQKHKTTKANSRWSRQQTTTHPLAWRSLTQTCRMPLKTKIQSGYTDQVSPPTTDQKPDPHKPWRNFRTTSKKSDECQKTCKNGRPWWRRGLPVGGGWSSLHQRPYMLHWRQGLGIRHI